MAGSEIDRRDFIKTVLVGLGAFAIDWSAFPRATRAEGDDAYDAIIIGSGLGGLSCAAAFARQGFKPLVLEMHDRAGGYATTFDRPGGFVFDASLHSTVVDERDGVRNLIGGFPEITEVKFVPHKGLYRAMFPEHDIRVPSRNVSAYIDLLAGHFPDERAGIEGLFKDMEGLSADIGKFSQAQGQVDMSRFPVDFPYLFKCYSKTWGQLVDEWIKAPQLKALVSSLWGYYGLPPSRLSCIYYALPTIGYLQEGGYYPVGKSQELSNAFVRFIETRGGTVKLGTRVEKILVDNHAAVGVGAADGKTYRARVVVSNANPFDTFRRMMPEEAGYLADYLAKMDRHSVSLSSFQVFLGLKKDLVRQLGIADTEVFFETGYDMDASYGAAQRADFSNPGFGITFYDNLYEGYSPKGKNTVNIITLQGYDHWEQFESDYFAGNKKAYRAEKERMADVLIGQAEKTIMPGLSKAVQVKEIGTPLTNLRYTGNHRGAVYGFDQTLDNSGMQRVPHDTPIKNLFLAGAWTRPGHGYTAVIWSGLECFGEIMRAW